jgi:hypothetical protein
MNELAKLPGQEKAINDIISQNINEITEIVNKGQYEEKKNEVLASLERINAFTSSPKRIQTMTDSGFVKMLKKLVDLTLKDKEVSSLNENLLRNEIDLLKKVGETLVGSDNDSTEVIKNIKSGHNQQCPHNHQREVSIQRSIFTITEESFWIYL